jgi:hypothetical protein
MNNKIQTDFMCVDYGLKFTTLDYKDFGEDLKMDFRVIIKGDKLR